MLLKSFVGSGNVCVEIIIAIIIVMKTRQDVICEGHKHVIGQHYF